MIERALIKDNTVRVTGELVEVESRTGTTKDGREYISGKVTVRVTDELQVDLHFFSMKLTKAGAISKLYNTYESLETLRNQRVTVTGNLEEARIPSGKELRSGNTLTLRFIGKARDNEENGTSFTVVGFVKQGLTNIYDEDGANIVSTSLVVAVPDYKNYACDYITLNVDPQNQKAINKISADYTVGSTVRLEGSLKFSISNIRKVIENDFGEDTVKSYQHIEKKYNITSGKLLIEDNEVYTQDEINELVHNTDERNTNELNARSKTSAAPKATGFGSAPATHNQPKLL